MAAITTASWGVLANSATMRCCVLSWNHTLRLKLQQLQKRKGLYYLGLLFIDGPMICRVRKSKNFPDSKKFHAKTFRIKRVNRDTFAFATKVRKNREFMYFWLMCLMSNWMKSELFCDFLDYLERFLTIWTVSWLSGQFLDYPGSLWNVLKVFRLSLQSLDCPDSV